MGRFEGPPKKNRFEGPPTNVPVENDAMETIPSDNFQGPDQIENTDLSKVPGSVETNDVLKAYAKMPEYQKAFQAIDDMVRLFGTGVTYGGSDTLGGNESRRLTDEARTRAGSAGMIAELGGGFASPATRLVGAGAKALAPVGKGIWQWLGRALTTAGEGGTIGGLGAVASGRPEDIVHDAALGAALPLAIKGGSKLATEPVKRVAAWLANKAHKDYSTAFRAGHTGNSDITSAFREGLARDVKLSTGKGTKTAYDAGRKLARLTPSQRAVMTTIQSLTPSGAGAYFLNPLAAGLPALIMAAGSPRLGAEISHAAGTVMGGLDMLASRGAVPALMYEQYKRQKKRKD